MGRHVVRPFVNMTKQRVAIRHQALHIPFEIAQHFRVKVKDLQDLNSSAVTKGLHPNMELHVRWGRHVRELTGWRTFDYAGHDVVFHAGAVQGYRGLVALVPERDLGIAIMWNGESSLPSGLLPTVLDSALGLPAQRWLDVDTDFGSDNLMAEGTPPAQQDKRKGASSNRAVASPR